MINYLALVTALLLSAIAAYYSIAGLAAIFAAAVIPIVIMGSALELAKVVAASWVYRNWNNAPASIRYYLTAAVVILMLITSMGTFGYLSKAHIDHTYSISDTTIVVKNLEREIEGEEQAIRTAQRNLDILDGLVTQANPNFIRNTQRREREAIGSQIRSSSERIKTLNTELTPLRQESARVEAEIGPIKYVADLIYGESDKGVIEKAVRLVIIVIVLVFDPLAIVLLLAANHGLKNKEQEPEEPKKKSPRWIKRVKTLKDKRDPSKIEIDKDKIFKM
jgi:hypothetical protein